MHRKFNSKECYFLWFQIKLSTSVMFSVIGCFIQCIKLVWNWWFGVSFKSKCYILVYRLALQSISFFTIAHNLYSQCRALCGSHDFHYGGSTTIIFHLLTLPVHTNTTNLSLLFSTCCFYSTIKTFKLWQCYFNSLRPKKQNLWVIDLWYCLFSRIP